MTFLDNGQQLEAQLHRLEPFTRQSQNELDEKEAALQALVTEHEKLKAALSTADGYYHRQKDDAEKLGREVETLSRLSAKASLFTERLGFRSAQSCFHKPLLLAAALLLLAATPLPFFLMFFHRSVRQLPAQCC
jgi:hypothetical protein